MLDERSGHGELNRTLVDSPPDTHRCYGVKLDQKKVNQIDNRLGVAFQIGTSLVKG